MTIFNGKINIIQTKLNDASATSLSNQTKAWFRNKALNFNTGKRPINVPDNKNQNGNQNSANEKKLAADVPNSKVKFEIYGEEMIEKRVKSSGNSGRVYLPPNWVGYKVKIIRTD